MEAAREGQEAVAHDRQPLSECIEFVVGLASEMVCVGHQRALDQIRAQSNAVYQTHN